MENIIIGIHGLGNKPPHKQLEDWWKMSMLEGLKNNNFNATLPRFELVYWADILHDIPQTSDNENDPYFLKERYAESPKSFPHEDHRIRKKIVGYVGQWVNQIFLNEDNSLNYSSITDAIVRKYFKDLDIYYKENCTDENAAECKAKDYINMRLAVVLEKYKNDRIMLVGHSMGTIVAYEVLNFVAPHSSIDTFVTMGSALGSPVVISKISAEQRKIQPDNHFIKTPKAVKNTWLNYADILDRVALDFELSDNFLENEYGVKPIDYLVVNDFELNGKRNPHKIYGYLRTPEFAAVLNAFNLSEKLSPKQKFLRKIKKLWGYFIELFR